MGDQPRRHHFVPQFYLAGFTQSASSDGDLYVFDQQQIKSWKSSPKQTAHMRDFHAIDVGPDGDPMVVEKALSKLESQWSSALRKVVEQKVLPNDESFADLMIFVAFMAVRVKRIREIVSGFIDRVSKNEIQAALATEEGRVSFRKVIEDQNCPMTDEEFEQLVSFGKSEQFEVDYDQTWHVQQIIKMAAQLAPILSLRKWVLWIVEDDVPDLICSDSPVTATWATPVRGPYSPAFGTMNTIVSVPLNRRVVLASIIEVQLPQQRLDREAVAAMNSATRLYGNQLYSPQPDFVWAMKNQQIGNAKDLFNYLQREKS